MPGEPRHRAGRGVTVIQASKADLKHHTACDTTALESAMADHIAAKTANGKISSLTGEFIDRELEQAYLSDHWAGAARQMRVVLLVSIVSYLFAFYQNHLDLGVGPDLWAIATAHLAQFTFMFWAVVESTASSFSPRFQYIVFAAELLTGVSETVEMLAYHHAGFVINLVSAPFYAFVILIFFIFFRIRWTLTTLATLIGSAVLLSGYAYIAWGHLDSIIRDPVMLLGIIAIGPARCVG